MMLLITILALSVGISGSEYRQQVYTSYEGQQLNTRIIKEVSARSRIDCASICLSTDGCVASEWLKKEKICRLKADEGHKGPLEDLLHHKDNEDVITSVVKRYSGKSMFSYLSLIVYLFSKR